MGGLAVTTAVDDMYGSVTGSVAALARQVLAGSGEHSAPVTHWAGRILLTLLLLALLTGLYWLMFRGWRRRVARQQDLPVPASVRPGPPAADPAQTNPAEPVEGVYASTTTSGSWLDRIAAHGLGVRSNAWVQVQPEGVFIAREAAPDLFIPAGDLCGAALGPGIAGKVTGGEGVLLITWRLGDRRLDTGFHPRARQDRARLLDQINALTQEGELA
jgi:hypothetical protein